MRHYAARMWVGLDTRAETTSERLYRIGQLYGAGHHRDQGLSRSRGSRRPVAGKGGRRVKDVYLTMGAYDFVVIFEAPEDETMAGILLEAGRLGTVRTNTMRAFPKADFERIVAGLS